MIDVTLLLDADSLIWAACYNKETSDWYTNESDVRDKYDKNLARIISEIGAFVLVGDLITFNGSRGNFRKLIGSNNTYKANRQESRLPLLLNEGHRYLKDHYNGVAGYGVETDDMVARKWNSLQKENGRDSVMIVSIDKDYRQLPCLLYNYHWNSRSLSDISEDEARYNFYAQMICGDQADNVNFLLGKGPVFSKKYLMGCETEYHYIKRVFLLFKTRYKSKAREKFIECYNLLKLRTN